MLDSKARHELEEDIRELRIELLAAARLDFLERTLDRPSHGIGTAMRERIEHVGERNNSRVDRNAFAGKLGRITAPIPALVMVLGDFLRHSQLENVALGQQLG